MAEDDIRLVLDKYKSSFFTFEIQPGIYTFKDRSEALFNILHLEHSASSSEIVIELDDITTKTNLVVRSEIIAITFDEKSFFNTVLGFTPGWDYKHYNEYISRKCVNLSSTNVIHLKCDVINGSVVNGVKQPILFSFISDKTSGYRVFCEPETIHFKKINKSVFNTITFCLENDDNEEVIFIGETLTFTLHTIKT